METQERTGYSVVSKIRMKDKNHAYRWVKHHMFYIYSPDNGRLRFALCLYHMTLTSSNVPDFMIVNIIKGKVVVKNKLDYKNILSPGELEVLKFLGEGYASKEIAGLLSISINTVNRYVRISWKS